MVSIFQWRQDFLDFAILKSFKSLTGMPIVPFIVEIIHFIQQARVAERYQLILYTWMNSSDCVEKGILSLKPSIDCSIDLISELMEGYRNITQSHVKMSWPKIFLFFKKNSEIASVFVCEEFPCYQHRPVRGPGQDSNQRSQTIRFSPS